ncbi:MAG: hypothetical protein GXN99_01280 [Candidatus Nanohaloarchaeota archaeon]|nr:hypothetical protein [Candidatus Nanohaloarchaeota archaeon]
MEHRIYIVVFLLSMMLAIPVYAETLDNVMNCDTIKTSDLASASDLQPVMYVMSYDATQDPVGNAHVANYSDNLADLGLSNTPNHVLVCGAGDYGNVKAVVVPAPGCKKLISGAVAVVNLSDVVNAHIQVVDPNDALPGSILSSNYNYQLCLYPDSEDYTSAIFCQTKYGGCSDVETAVFKFTGAVPGGTQNIKATNAHYYEPMYVTGEGDITDYYYVCCRYVVGAESDVIIDVSTPTSGLSPTSGLISEPTNKKLYVLVGLTDYFVVKIFNPSSTPKLVDLYLESSDEIFNNFIWFGDDTNKYSDDPRHVQLTIPPKQYKSVIVNVFGGKVGVYDLIIKKRINGDPATEDVLYNTSVTIIPGRVEGTVESSPEGSYLWLLLGLSTALLYLIK